MFWKRKNTKSLALWPSRTWVWHPRAEVLGSFLKLFVVKRSDRAKVLGEHLRHWYWDIGTLCTFSVWSVPQRLAAGAYLSTGCLQSFLAKWVSCISSVCDWVSECVFMGFFPMVSKGSGCIFLSVLHLIAGFSARRDVVVVRAVWGGPRFLSPQS